MNPQNSLYAVISHGCLIKYEYFTQNMSESEREKGLSQNFEPHLDCRHFYVDNQEDP